MECKINTDTLKDIKLIVFDLDGTLLNNDNQIGEETIELVKKLRQLGVRFSIASGRLHSAIIEHAATLEIKTPLISLDGCLIKSYPEEKILFESFVPKRYVTRALELADKMLLKIALCQPEAILYTEENSIIQSLLEKYGAKYQEVDNYEPYVKNTLEVVAASDYKDGIRNFMNKMTFPYTFGLGYSYYKSYSKGDIYYFEIRKHGSNKGTGIQRLSKHLRINPNHIAAIGDWHNDREMFDVVGVKVAVANAIPEIKYHADIICSRTNDEEGVAEFLKLVYNEKVK
ncbi:MAG: Cof-type HAD-IIB family hydrolase [Ignavibacteriales bacterium]